LKLIKCTIRKELLEPFERNKDEMGIDEDGIDDENFQTPTKAQAE
jgi:hypothetical protein